MNCYILAAGPGNRLSSLTEKSPKCLLEVGGKPMLAWWLDAVFACRCFKKVFVNLSYLAEKVEEWIEDYEKKSDDDRSIEKIDERKKLLGTAGTLYWYGETGEDFMTVYPDTLSFDTFEKLSLYVEEWKYLREKNGKSLLAGILTFDTPEDLSSGTLTTDRDGWVTKFMEKGIAGRRAWSGVLFGAEEIYDYIKPTDRDLALDVLPRLIGRMKAIANVDAYDIGRSVEHYERAREKFYSLQARRN